MATTYCTKNATAIINSSGGFDAWAGYTDFIPIGMFANLSYKSRGFFYFPFDFSQGTSVTAAVVHFKQRPNSAGYCIPATNKSITVNIGFMERDWDRGTDRGNLWSENEKWNFSNRAKKSFNGIENYTGVIQKTFTQNDNGFWTADISDIVNIWFLYYKSTGVHPNYGIIVFNDHEDFTSTDADFGFDIYSMESTKDNRPYVTYTLATNTPPSAPVNVSPSGWATPPNFTIPIVSTTTPRFYAELSDPDPNDWISAYEIRVYTGAHNDVLLWDSGRVATNGQPNSVSVVYGSVVGTGASYYAPLSLAGQNGTTVSNLPKWIIRMWDSAGNVSPYHSDEAFIVNSAPTAPTVAIVESPILDLRTLTPHVVVTHNDPDPKDTKAYGYQVIVTEISSNADVYDTDRVDISGAPLSTIQVQIPSSSLDWGLTYDISAVTKDSAGSWSTATVVRVTTHQTGVPINLSPADNSVTSTSPVFNAERANTFESITSFDLAVYSDDLSTQMLPPTTFTATISNGATITKTYVGAALQSGSFYRWQIRATSNIGGTSEWSDLIRFKILADATVPTPTAPLGVVSTLTPTLQGARATAFNRFQYEIYPVTATTDNPGTPIYASGTISQTSATSFSSVYGGSPALEWGTSYKWRVRVSSDAGVTWSNWSDIVSFSTTGIDSPNMGTSTPAPDDWLDAAPTTFTVQWNGTDTMDKSEVQIYTEGDVLVWDSGLTDLSNGTSQTITYGSGGSPTPAPTLTPGKYYWKAKYQAATSGIQSRYSPPSFFRINTPPDAPSNMFPTPSYVFADTLLPIFEANFSDADVDIGDTPHDWDIELEVASDGTPISVPPITFDSTTGVNGWESGDAVGLVAGKNSYQWQEGDAALDYGIDYKWRTRFKDSKLAWGTWSGYNQFRLAQSPTATITSPTNGTNVNVTTPTITWSYDGTSVQQKFKIAIDRVMENGDFMAHVYSATITSALHSFQIPTAKLHNSRYYTITITVFSADGLADTAPDTVQVFVALDAPDPITGLAPHVDADSSRIQLRWDRPLTLKNTNGQHFFSAYYIYRKRPEDDEWERLATNLSIDDVTYDDYYARQGISVLYRISIATTKSAGGVEFESPDDSNGGNIAQVTLDTDNWMLVGRDRSEDHIYVIPVTDESHTQVIQQESFEPLGATRKVIIRGFVLGNEGSFTALFVNRPDPDSGTSLTIIGRRMIDYIVNHPGPHTLKSPFGDVWDVQFEGPEMHWQPSGNLEVSANWTETGTTPVEEL